MNPFRYNQVLPAGAPYCPRPELENALLQTIESQQRAVLIGDRRVGKTTTVEHTLRTREGHVFITVDLHGLVSVPDFIERVRSNLDAQLTRERALTKKLPAAVLAAAEAIAALKIHLPLGIEIEARPVHTTTINEIMAHVSRVSEWRPVTIFFDEFQEITEHLPADQAHHVLGVLRAAIQRQPKTSYIFAGSSRDALTDIFTATGSPFYKGARILEVGPIERPAMEQFILQQFATSGRQLDRESLNTIFMLAGDNPNDLQELCYHLWARSSPGLVTREHIRDGFATLMRDIGRTGERVLGDATPTQRRALFALALRAGEVAAFGDEFRTFAGFTHPQNVVKALSKFLQGDMAILDKKAGRITFRERFIRLWLVGYLLRNPSAFPPTATYSSEWLQSVRPFLAPDVTRFRRLPVAEASWQLLSGQSESEPHQGASIG